MGWSCRGCEVRPIIPKLETVLGASSRVTFEPIRLIVMLEAPTQAEGSIACVP